MLAAENILRAVTAQAGGSFYVYDQLHGYRLEQESDMDYEILTASDPDSLIEKIREWQGDGWQPHGSPFAYTADREDSDYFAQAVVRKTSTDPRRLSYSYEELDHEASEQFHKGWNSALAEAIAILRDAALETAFGDPNTALEYLRLSKEVGELQLEQL